MWDKGEGWERAGMRRGMKRMQDEPSRDAAPGSFLWFTERCGLGRPRLPPHTPGGLFWGVPPFPNPALSAHPCGGIRPPGRAGIGDPRGRRSSSGLGGCGAGV